MSLYKLDDFDSWETPYAPAPTPPAPAPTPKKKNRAGLWVVIILLLAALIAEPFALLALQKESATVSGAQINESGELVLQYSDGRTENLGVVVGQDGSDGADGEDGQDGQDGADGVGGAPGVSGSTDVSAAVTKGLRSSVSIFCTFTEEGRWGQTAQYYSAGSGVIYRMNKESGDAFIITNYHVVFDANSRTENGIAELIQLYLYGSEISGMEIEATYVGGSQNYDIAILRVEGSEVLKNSAACAVTLGARADASVGSTAIAIGNPEGEGISASLGVVSVDSEYITMTGADGISAVEYRVMRIDTAVNSGNSGGGLFDGQGRLIGIVNAKIMDDEVENIGYALPVATVLGVADNIIDYCYGTDCETVMRPIIGITVVSQKSTAVYDKETGKLSIVQTVEVYEVSPGQIGSVFQVGDVFVSAKLDDATLSITRQHHVIDLMLTARPGDTVIFTVLRGGKEITVEVTVTEDCLTAY